MHDLKPHVTRYLTTNWAQKVFIVQMFWGPVLANRKICSSICDSESYVDSEDDVASSRPSG